MTGHLKPIVMVVFCVVNVLVASRAGASGTVVGNGGDPVFEFMEAARTSMIETIKVIVNDPKELNQFCQNTRISAEQIQFCRDFFRVVAIDILRLSQGPNKTLFVLREESLSVVGPDGKPMMVAARTNLGPLGVIELHRDSVKTMLPTQILFLLTHEFQHKANYYGRSISDNESIGPFVTGRDLLDSVSSGVVAMARKKGLVGSQFGIRDIFDCRVFTDTAEFGARLSSSRLFRSEDLMAYETSLGKNPTDGTIFLPETSQSALQFRFVVTEPNNCGDFHPERKSVVQILRSTRLVNGTQEDTVVVSREISENPLCPDNDHRIEISQGKIRFVCHYYGSEGTTSSPWGLRASNARAKTTPP